MKGMCCGARLALVLVAGLLGTVAFATASAAARPPLKVCPSGCVYTTVAAALAAAPDGATVIVGPGTYVGSLDITRNVTLQGSGPSATTIEAPVPIDLTAGGPVVVVEPSVAATIRGVTITGGSPNFGSASTCYSGDLQDCVGGGAIRNSGTLSLVGDLLDHNVGGPILGGGGGGIFNTSGAALVVVATTISNNAVTESGIGGGILNRGSATISDSLITGNAASFSSAIANDGTMLLRNTTVSQNVASPFVLEYSVAVGNSGTLVARDSVFTDNSSGGFLFGGIGGAVDNGGTASFYGCTVARNTARYGGGFFNAGTLMLSGCSVTQNVATGTGGGIYTISGEGTLTLRDSDVSGNTGGDVVFAPAPSWP